MEKLFELRNKLNIKKIALTAIIILVIICLIFLTLSIIKHNKKNNNLNSKFISSDNSISVELSNKYNLSKYKSVQDYILELRSPNNINIFFSHKDLIENRTFNDIVSSDKKFYIENFNSYSNLSDIAELTVNGYPAYSYSFHYLDSKDERTPYYLQILWIETENGYYIIDCMHLFPKELL